MEALKYEDHYTYRDYCTWDDSDRWELIDGLPYAMAPAPSIGHQSILVKLVTQLAVLLDGKPCKVLAAPTDVRLNADSSDDTVVQPDILVVCDRTKLEDGKSVVGAPDLIIEILSPSTAKHDMLTKKRLYQKSGVREYWIVDPDSKAVAVNVLHNGRYNSRFFDERDTAVPVEVLDGCTINFTDVFEAL